MTREIHAVVIDPVCPICRGTGGIHNPFYRLKTWRRIEGQALKLIRNYRNIDIFPNARMRLLKFRRLARRYQITRPCPRCVRKRAATAKDVAKRMGIESWHPHYAIIEDWTARGLAGWHWPKDTSVFYTAEKFLAGKFG